MKRSSSEKHKHTQFKTRNKERLPENDIGSSGSLQSPLTVGERLVLARVSGGFDDTSGRLDMELALFGAAQFVAVVATVVVA